MTSVRCSRTTCFSSLTAWRRIQRLTQRGRLQLEWQFIALFDRREHRPHFLQRELAARPEFFLEVLSLVYRGEGEEPRKLSPEDELRARHAYRLLNAWRTAPGTTEDGRIDAPALLEWVRSARRLSSSVNRGAIGDQVIGQVLSGAGA